MPTWVHRTEVYLLTSTSPASLPEPEVNYIQDPDLAAVAGQPLKYWKVVGDQVQLQTAGEQAATDAAIQTSERDASAARLDQVEDILRAFALVVLDEFNTLRALHSLNNRTIAQLKTAIRNKLGN